jgi:adenine deaminase
LVPGFSLHDEPALLVAEGGFTPLEALQATTRDPALFLGREKDLGTVERGKLADLVLLDADPLADIHNTKFAAVVANGRLLPRRGTGPDAGERRGLQQEEVRRNHRRGHRARSVGDGWDKARDSSRR